MPHIDALQVADRAAVRALNIIAAQLDLGKPDRLSAFLRKEEGRLPVCQQACQFLRQLVFPVVRLQGQRQPGQGTQI